MRACLMSVAAGALLLLPACSPATAPAAETPVTEAAAIAPVFDEANPPALVETSFEIAGDRVNGIVYVANGPGPHPTVVLLHGLPGNERSLDVAQDLRREGFNVLFFHYRGAWGSEGEFSVSNVIEDVGGATAYVRANAVALRADPARILLVGHSLGGFAALQGAARDPAITCVAALTPGDLGAMAAMAEGDPAVAAGFAASVDAMDMLDVDGKTMAAEVIANKDAFDLRLLAPKMVGKSVLVVVADKDTVTPPTMVMAVAAAYKATPGVKVSGVELSGDHSFSWSRNELSDTVVDWAKGCAGSP
jgi:pimeloyl-ACP methyl ester carboxylesterase